MSIRNYNFGSKMSTEEKESLKILKDNVFKRKIKTSDSSDEDDVSIVNGKKIKIEPISIKVKDSDRIFFKGVSEDNECFSESEMGNCSYINNCITDVFSKVFDDLIGSHICYDKSAGRSKVILTFKFIPDEAYNKKEDKRAFTSIVNLNAIKNNNVSPMKRFMDLEILNRDTILNNKGNKDGVANQVAEATSKCKITKRMLDYLTMYVYNNPVPGQNNKNKIWEKYTNWWCDFQTSTNAYGYGNFTNIVCNVVLDAEKLIKDLCDGSISSDKYIYQIQYYAQNSTNTDYLIKINRFNTNSIKRLNRNDGVNFLDLPRYVDMSKFNGQTVNAY